MKIGTGGHRIKVGSPIAMYDMLCVAHCVPGEGIARGVCVWSDRYTGRGISGTRLLLYTM